MSQRADKESETRTHDPDAPCVGIFPNLLAADRAVTELLRSGFTKDEVSVIAPDGAATSLLDEEVVEEPVDVSAGAAAGGAIGAALGGLTAAAGIVATGGAGLLVAGALVASGATGALAGGLIGAMSARGVRPELADFYDQAVRKGRVLVAVETPDESRRKDAERIFEMAGAQPITVE